MNNKLVINEMIDKNIKNQENYRSGKFDEKIITKSDKVEVKTCDKDLLFIKQSGCRSIIRSGLAVPLDCQSTTVSTVHKESCMTINV